MEDYYRIKDAEGRLIAYQLKYEELIKGREEDLL